MSYGFSIKVNLTYCSSKSVARIKTLCTLYSRSIRRTCSVLLLSLLLILLDVFYGYPFNLIDPDRGNRFWYTNVFDCLVRRVSPRTSRTLSSYLITILSVFPFVFLVFQQRSACLLTFECIVSKISAVDKRTTCVVVLFRSTPPSNTALTSLLCSRKSLYTVCAAPRRVDTTCTILRFVSSQDCPNVIFNRYPLGAWSVNDGVGSSSIVERFSGSIETRFCNIKCAPDKRIHRAIN